MDHSSVVNSTLFDTWKIIYLSATIILVMCIKKLLTKSPVPTKSTKSQNKPKNEASVKELATKGKDSTANSTTKSKKKTDNRWTGRSDKQTFSHPWLVTSLKGHSGPILDVDFSSDGKYLASCGEDALDPDGEATSSSGSECNKDNIRPLSTEPPHKKKLSRRQRKNRRLRDEAVSASSSPEITKKKNKRSNNKQPQQSQQQPQQQQKSQRQQNQSQQQRSQKYSKMYGTSGKFSKSDPRFALCFWEYVLTGEQLVTLGYPVESAYYPERAVIYKSPSANQSKHRVTPRFDVNAREFVPRVIVNGHDNLHVASINYSKINQQWSAGHETLSADSGQGSGTSSPLSIETEGGDLNDVADIGAPLFPLHGGGITEERKCVRCGRGFFVGPDGEYLTHEHCVYHWGKFHNVPMPRNGTARAQYTCCKGDENAVGCTKGRLHVWNGLGLGFNGPLEGYVQTKRRECASTDGNHGVYALDCEMCYTYGGLELAKITVVALDGQIVYDSFVRPKHDIIDYNTRFSGITAKDMLPYSARPLRIVQNDLLSFVNADTILVGHGLENDLRALKILHRAVVDTAVTFPHFRGLPFKNSLKSLAACYLRRDIQISGEHGHDSVEDARACLDLMVYRISKDFHCELSSSAH